MNFEGWKNFEVEKVHCGVSSFPEETLRKKILMKVGEEKFCRSWPIEDVVVERKGKEKTRCGSNRELSTERRVRGRGEVVT